MAVPEITINKLNRYEMPQLIQEAYQNVHNWFELDPEFKNYKRFSYDQDAQRVLRRDNFADAAYNFHIYFPTHYFKVCHALQSDRVIGVERLAAWLRYTPYLSVVDMGCGDGAASVAAISSVINLKREHRLDVRKIQLMCIGIDPNPHGLVIYKRMLEEVREASAPFGIDIKIQPLRSRLSEAAGSVENCLFDVRQAWKQPSLSHTVLIMSNLMDILYNEHNKDSDSLRRYEKFGLALDEPFGEPISAFVRNLFDGVPIDHLHMLSIDTEPKQIEDAVIKMVGSLHLRMEEKQHTFDHEQIRLEKIELINPAPSYWFRKKGSNSYRLDEFLIFAAHIHNHDLTADERWKLITSPENLELAWARARQEMLRESLVDEIEIRLFEQDLTENLHRLHFELENYAIHSGYLPQILHYGFPKNTEHDRPRGLTWLEEAILLVAIIQIIGIPQLRNNSQSYAYLLSPENSIERKATEYLYERWTTAWQRYRSDIEDYARKYPTGVVIKVDIKSYYTRILHDRLRLILREELQISRRIEWLIELLVSKEIKDHDPGRGLVQGSIGSGFLSNLYLSPFDNLFPRNDAKQRRLFRYVDDIVVVVPDPNDEEITKNSLDMVLADLALEANEDKTGTYTISDFLKLIERDPVLDDLNQRYETFMDSLWWLDNELRDQFSTVLLTKHGGGTTLDSIKHVLQNWIYMYPIHG